MKPALKIRLVYSQSGDGTQILDLIARATMDRLAPKTLTKAVFRHKGATDGRPAASSDKARSLFVFVVLTQITLRPIPST
jgi:hypothetical protein